MNTLLQGVHQKRVGLEWRHARWPCISAREASFIIQFLVCQQGENSKMCVISGALTFALTCACLLAVAGASELEGSWAGSEKELYQSVFWEPNFGSLIILGDGKQLLNCLYA